jgi:hypothetical protein
MTIGGPPGGNSPRTPDSKIPEYSFEEGMEEAARRIQALFEQSDSDIYVVVNGSGINVGKTKFTGTLSQKLTHMGINTETHRDVARTHSNKVVVFNIPKAYLQERTCPLWNIRKCCLEIVRILNKQARIMGIFI